MASLVPANTPAVSAYKQNPDQNLFKKHKKTKQSQIAKETQRSKLLQIQLKSYEVWIDLCSERVSSQLQHVISPCLFNDLRHFFLFSLKWLYDESSRWRNSQWRREKDTTELVLIIALGLAWKRSATAMEDSQLKPLNGPTTRPISY